MDQSCQAQTQNTSFTPSASSSTSGDQLSDKGPQHIPHLCFALLFPALLLLDAESLPWEFAALNTTYETSPYIVSHISTEDLVKTEPLLTPESH